MAKAVSSFSQKSAAELLAEGRRANPDWSDLDIKLWADSKKHFDTSLFTRPRNRRWSYQYFATQVNCPSLLATAKWGIVSNEIAENVRRHWRSSASFSWARIPVSGKISTAIVSLTSKLLTRNFWMPADCLTGPDKAVLIVPGLVRFTDLRHICIFGLVSSPPQTCDWR
jgi:hypothetical protein